MPDRAWTVTPAEDSARARARDGTIWQPMHAPSQPNAPPAARLRRAARPQEAAAPPRRPHRRRAQGAARASSGCPASAPSSSPPTTSPGWSTTRREMTDLPAAPARRAGRRRCCPTLMTPLRTLEADKGTTRKTLWKLFDGALVESVLMRYPDRATMCVSSPGRLRHGLPVLRHRPGRPAAQHVRPPRSSSRSSPAPGRWPAARSPAARAGSPTWCSWAWASRWPTTRPSSAPYAGSPTRRPTGSACPRAASPSRTVGLVPRINQLADEGIPVTLALSPARARRRAAQRAGADQHPLVGRTRPSRRPGTTRARPSAGSRSSTP